MDKLIKGYYHCRECGALFESPIQEVGKLKCTVCGKSPMGDAPVHSTSNFSRKRLDESLDFKEILEYEAVSPRVSQTLHGVNHDSQDIYESTVAALKAKAKIVDGPVKRKKRIEKKSPKKVLVVVGWLVLMFGCVYFFKFSGDEKGLDSEKKLDVAGASGDQMSLEFNSHEKEILKRKRVLAVQAAIPVCKTVMAEFLESRSTAGKSQFVSRGIQLSGAMTRYYKDSLDFTRQGSKFGVVSADLLDGFKKETLGVLFLNDRRQKWEAVFVREDDGWKIDWEFLVRYDDRSWSLFPTAYDGDEGEFRLYMRVRDSNKGFDQKEMSLVFYKPDVFLRGDFHGVASKPVSVLIDSDLGRQIKAIMAQEKAPVFGVQEVRKDAHGFILSEIDPPRYHRVRVKMKVHKVGDDKKKSELELLEILANDWYGVESSEDQHDQGS